MTLHAPFIPCSPLNHHWRYFSLCAELFTCCASSSALEQTGSLRHAADDAAHVPRVRNCTNKRSNICSLPQITDFTSKCQVHFHNFTGKQPREVPGVFDPFFFFFCLNVFQKSSFDVQNICKKYNRTVILRRLHTLCSILTPTSRSRYKSWQYWLRNAIL